MQTIEIKGNVRAELGKKSTKAIRAEGKVPCVIYGGDKVIHFTALEAEFRKIIYTPNVYLINVNVDGTVYPTVLQDTQFHPVKEQVLHADFLEVREGKPVTIEIPVKLDGFAEGVKAGGKLQLEKRKLKVKALAENLPDTLDINIDSIGLGQTIQVGNLSYDNLELLNAKNAVVVAVRLTRAARAAQQSGGEAAAE
ncbi:50S ribosomal protein L25/general stress protein Ctc [Carboxylicivirga sp. M1479]|uniref:50S ribosomal protein L25/general stress protein Ctc n=1 Tax=Carboxylicivirga sp. M1479 TaxID=2594476 RepID=UPI0011787288|nr:50S ribosomal protein L25/general stress protein Ctc [Carboxylicivirga sp. M1479]TRX72156.1 50S ribosomal protein L25/general stress protein Ctc [Carboxylicivirga sp. M1479]